MTTLLAIPFCLGHVPHGNWQHAAAICQLAGPQDPQPSSRLVHDNHPETMPPEIQRVIHFLLSISHGTSWNNWRVYRLIHFHFGFPEGVDIGMSLASLRNRAAATTKGGHLMICDLDISRLAASAAGCFLRPIPSFRRGSVLLRPVWRKTTG